MSRNFELLKQIELEAGIPEIPAIPISDRSVAKRSVAEGPVSGEIQRLVQSVFLANSGSAPRKVLFCGVEADNGSSAICGDAARSLAANCAKSVCLVDANVNSARLSAMFGTEIRVPIFGNSAALRESCIQVTNNLWLASTDLMCDKPGSLLSAESLKLRFSHLIERFDYVLIDAPGATVSADALLLGQIADATVLVVEANMTRRQIARKAKDTLEAAGVRIIGTVLHNRTFPIPEKLYSRL